jgi:hypothetical protein
VTGPGCFLGLTRRSNEQPADIRQCDSLTAAKFVVKMSRLIDASDLVDV